MQLTQFSDYSLRLVLYLATHPDEVVTLQEVSEAYRISQHHLVKVAKRLIDAGTVASVRGRRGGLRLNWAPTDIRIGELVRMTEPHFNLVECFDRARNTCPIEGACGLTGVLQEARDEFFGVLDRHTLADFIPRAPALLQLWRATAATGSQRTPSPG